MRAPLLTALAMTFLLGACVRRAPEPPPNARAEVRVLFVDRSAREGGDGTRERPYRSVVDALAQPGPLELRVATGLYEGALQLRQGVRVVGTGTVVLHADAERVVDANGGALEGVLIQGGQVGLTAHGDVELLRVGFSGQRKIAIELRSGSLRATALTLEASVSETIGLEIGDGTKATLVGLTSRGPFRRAVELNGGDTSVASGDFVDAVTAVHANAGRLSVRRLTSRGGRGPAVFVGGAKVKLEDADLFGHEYGVLAGQGAQLEVSDLLSVGAERAGVAISQSERAQLEEVTVVDSGTFAGIQLVNANVSVRNFRVHHALTAGVVVRGGTAKLENGVITRTRASDQSSGDGVLVRIGRAELTSVLIADSEGAGVVVGNAAEAKLRDLIVDRAQAGGVVADYQGQIRADSVIIKSARQAAWVAIEGAKIEGAGVWVEGNTESLAWAECNAGSTISLKRVTTTIAPQPTPCVTITR